MTPPCVFRRSVVLDATPETVFRFHEDPRNIRHIAPSFLSAKVLQAGHEARVGEEFTLELGLLGIPLLRWIGVWREVEPGRRLVDEARRSPFALFRHQHIFEPVEGFAAGWPRTRLTDHVTYQLPGGWIGKLLGETLVRAQMALAFADRHRRTRRWASEEAANSNLVE